MRDLWLLGYYSMLREGVASVALEVDFEKFVDFSQRLKELIVSSAASSQTPKPIELSELD